MNPIRQLLDDVLTTGQLPTDADIHDVVTRGTVQERRQARQSLLREARRVLGALDSNLPDQARQAADNAADEFALFTEDKTAVNARDLAADVPRNQHHIANRPARPNSQAAEQLRNLLGSRIRTGVTAADLTKLAVRGDATPDQVNEWRTAVLAAGQQISDTHREGQQAVARRLVVEHASNLAGLLDNPEHRDPAEDVDDPRELANLIPRDRSQH